MKVKLTIEIELPDQTADVLAEIREDLGQVLFDSYINYATCSHAEDAVIWCAEAKVGSKDEDSTAKAIFEYHNNWKNICRNAIWNFEVI